MTLENLIGNYGYYALFIGTLLEGETIMLIAGFMAHQSYLNIYLTIAVGFAGTLLCDQFLFFLGRFKGQAFLAKYPNWENNVKKPEILLKRHQNFFILSFRFMYGLRTIAPFFIGLSQVSITRFLLLNLLGGFIWAVCFALIGYYSGYALENLLQDIKHIELEIISAIVLLGIIIWVVHFWRKRQGKRSFF